MTWQGYIRANPDLLPMNWQKDPFVRDEVHRDVRRHARDGYSHREISLRVGLSSRGVCRILNREEIDQPRCGAHRALNHREGRKPRDRGYCTQLVPAWGDRCRFHQNSERDE